MFENNTWHQQQNNICKIVCSTKKYQWGLHNNLHQTKHIISLSCSSFSLNMFW